MKPYTELLLMPNVVASSVCLREYTGEDMSPRSRSDIEIVKIENLRKQMKESEIHEFESLFDRLCHDAYDARTEWFMKIVNAKAERGREQLYVYAYHWLKAYLLNPVLIKRKITGV